MQIFVRDFARDFVRDFSWEYPRAGVFPRIPDQRRQYGQDKVTFATQSSLGFAQALNPWSRRWEFSENEAGTNELTSGDDFLSSKFFPGRLWPKTFELRIVPRHCSKDFADPASRFSPVKLSRPDL
ncbi:MAG: hypothetical protein HC771_21105 [Synechococcales cyanobacterium CRU_2_2]|nr:hypothetical protein [Synechococcales cyanobacterium CRU_2_2]